ncbi:MAG TPA: hypothetical protein HA282_03095 [Nanoarchaeota archaeon]|nr:MAG: hypothetical protein QT01_C0006G0041 [archaeon GW2011_AR6]MBS3082903.1 hypothetical protein [Candidatus Pacearchaeota archaeon]HIH18116.1 hypothetical protein [Nanoarchaeota archaeon]HIH34484.1 hypothetical protein [Nanoarchaeota archaeon]HIH51565.1 hypothetical protein [Nanoarchaeota archaeon]
MKLNNNGIGLALAIATGILYAVCRLIVALFPDGSQRFFLLFIHSVDLTQLPVATQTFSGFVLGLVVSVVSAYILGWIFAWVYNKFDKK